LESLSFVLLHEILTPGAKLLRSAANKRVQNHTDNTKCDAGAQVAFLQID